MEERREKEKKRAKQNALVPTSENSDSQLNAYIFHPTLEDWRHFGKIKLNELGRQKLGR